MNRKEAAIVSAYTGVLIGNFDDFHKYAEEILNRPVFTHEMARRDIWNTIKEKSRDDFLKINIDGGE